jgi:hypothetical protein
VVVLVRVCAQHYVPPWFSEPNVVLPPVGNGLGMIRRESISNLVPRPPIAPDVLLVVLAPLLKIYFCVVFSVEGDGEGAEEATQLEDGADVHEGVARKCDIARHEVVLAPELVLPGI